MEDLDPTLDQYARDLLGRHPSRFMPFGKYKGRPLSDVPAADLETYVFLGAVEPFRTAVLRELYLRHPEGPPR